VWKDSRVLGKQAAEFANMIADGKALTEIPGVIKFSGGAKGVEVNAVLIPPNPITKANLNDVIDAGWVTKAEVCAGAAADVAACK
jgi:D-xylose transport system substrate-binding protein